MSFFGMGASMGSMPVSPEKIQFAEDELAIMQTLHQGIVDGCKQKCFVPYYTESELSKGESCCVDRCSSKFFQVNNLIGNHLKSQHVTPHHFTSPSYVAPTLGQHSGFE